jgi:hypothetical protein
MSSSDINLVVAVKSCHRDRAAGFHDAIRETWGRDLHELNVPVVFFVGGGTVGLDEVAVSAPDDYMGLPQKTQAICKWFFGASPQHLFLCDNDTFIDAEALVNLPYKSFDYSGHFRGGQSELGATFYYQDHIGVYPKCHSWASGGIGYFLSSKAVATLALAPPPTIWAEDMWVGQELGPMIQSGNFSAAALKLSGTATWHFRKSKRYPEFTPELLRRAHREGTLENIYEEAHAC